MTEEEKIGDDFDMQAFLIEQMTKAANGELELKRSRAIADLAQQVYNLDKLELELLKRAPETTGAAA